MPGLKSPHELLDTVAPWSLQVQWQSLGLATVSRQPSTQHKSHQHTSPQPVQHPDTHRHHCRQRCALWMSPTSDSFEKILQGSSCTAQTTPATMSELLPAPAVLLEVKDSKGGQQCTLEERACMAGDYNLCRLQQQLHHTCCPHNASHCSAVAQLVHGASSPFGPIIALRRKVGHKVGVGGVHPRVCSSHAV